jgi:hypothetical protein
MMIVEMPMIVERRVPVVRAPEVVDMLVVPISKIPAMA